MNRATSTLAAAATAALLALCAGTAVADDIPQLTSNAPVDSGWLAAPRVSPSCPTSVDKSRFATPDQLYAADGVEGSYGPRPTGSPNHRAFVDYIAGRLAKMPGVKVDSVSYPIRRWTQKHAGLTVRAAGGNSERLPIAGPIPYSLATGTKGTAAPLVYLPAATPLTKANSAGKIVVRDQVVASVPNAALVALSWFLYDPKLTISLDPLGNYVRENDGVRADDLQAAGAAGAAGVIFLNPLPTAQIKGQYAPYEGIQWPVPSVLLGGEESARVKDLAQHGGSARITITATIKKISTRMLIATLPGMSAEKTIIQSHTDGMNALWDNGPVAILAMADYFSKLGRDCLPRTLQFVFTTGHLYQHLVAPDRDGSAEQFAKQVDRQYDNGQVAEVLAMEHMGARGYTTAPRSGGKPGQQLVLDKNDETTSIFIGDSPSLVASTLQAVTQNRVTQTIALRGADLPGLQIPPNDNFGGEGNPYQHHLIPTIALVTAPWPLFDPAFTLQQLVDKDLFYRQTLAFTDIVHITSTIPRALLGGGYIAYRDIRTLMCGTGLEALGLVRHCY